MPCWTVPVLWVSEPAAGPLWGSGCGWWGLGCELGCGHPSWSGAPAKPSTPPPAPVPALAHSPHHTACSDTGDLSLIKSFKQALLTEYIYSNAIFFASYHVYKKKKKRWMQLSNQCHLPDHYYQGQNSLKKSWTWQTYTFCWVVILLTLSWRVLVCVAREEPAETRDCVALVILSCSAARPPCTSLSMFWRSEG